MIVLLELLAALLEYIDPIMQLPFFKQELILLHKYLTCYAGIISMVLGTYYTKNYASIISGSLSNAKMQGQL